MFKLLKIESNYASIINCFQRKIPDHIIKNTNPNPKNTELAPATTISFVKLLFYLGLLIKYLKYVLIKKEYIKNQDNKKNPTSKKLNPNLPKCLGEIGG